MKIFSLVLLLALIGPNLVAAELDYAEPPLLTGTIVAPGTTNVLYHFRRTTTRTSNTVQVLRMFNYPDGKLAARERATYVNGKLGAFQVDELQISAQGNAQLEPDPKNPAKTKISFDYTVGDGRAAKKKTDSETTDGDVLIGDMIPYFIVRHWGELMRGNAAKFRFVVPARLETVGFKLVKDSEVTWRGQSCIKLRMEPTSVIIAQIVDPLFFTVEKSGAHRIVEYDGRSTPKIRRGNSWKDLDAVNLYDWK
jgi:hypothetical protein